MFNKYHKISAPFERDMETGKLTKNFIKPEFEFLSRNYWAWTEKVDGMNIRIYWDGYDVSFAGRTDKALIPPELYELLKDIFGSPSAHQKFDEIFGENEVIIFGEGYGGKIQNGNEYSKQMKFIMFDATINEHYQDMITVYQIASTFGVEEVPLVMVGTIEDAIHCVQKHPNSLIAEGKQPMEGLVGKPEVELLSRFNERVITKIKYKDFKEW